MGANLELKETGLLIRATEQAATAKFDDQVNEIEQNRNVNQRRYPRRTRNGRV